MSAPRVIAIDRKRVLVQSGAPRNARKNSTALRGALKDAAVLGDSGGL